MPCRIQWEMGNWIVNRAEIENRKDFGDPYTITIPNAALVTADIDPNELNEGFYAWIILESTP